MKQSHRTLREAFVDVLARKQNTPEIATGLMGTYISGAIAVAVPDRKGYVYVRLRGDVSETIEAFNDAVIRSYDLPVVLIKEGSKYTVVGKNVGIYSEWPDMQPNHGDQHSFGGGTGSYGSDIVWVAKRQFTPFELGPTNPQSMRAYVQPDYYASTLQYQYFGGTGTVDFTPALPSSVGDALMMLVYFDTATSTFGYITGSVFSLITVPTDPNPYLPTLAPATGIPLGAIYLYQGQTAITWDNIYDLRPIVAGGGNGSVPLPLNNLLVGSAGGIATAFPPGSAGQYLHYNGSIIDWANVSGTYLPPAVRGDIAYGDSTPKWNRLPLGASGTVVTSNGTDIVWNAGGGGGGTHNLLSATHPDTVANSPVRGALIRGNSTPAWEEYALGASGTVLTSSGVDAVWAAAGGGGGAATGTAEYPWHVEVNPTLLPNAQSSFSTLALDPANHWPEYLQSAGSQNAYVEFKVLLAPGTWSVYWRHVKNNNNGIFTVSLDGNSIGTSDAYNASLVFSSTTITGVSVATAGGSNLHLLRFTMATKNGSSSNYYGQINWIQCLRTA